VEQVARSWADEILPFNGTCGIWRRAAIESAGGWHGDTLTEDLDLSYRAQLAGWRANYLVSVGVPGELPVTLGVWQKQQLRWNKGFAQTARKLLPAIWFGNASWSRKVESTFHLGGCVYGILSVAEGIFGAAALALGTITFPIVLPLAGLALFQGVAGALGMAILGQNLLNPMRPDRSDVGLRQTLTSTFVTIGMHIYSGVMTAWGVLQGVHGHDSAFERTPKTGAMASEMSEETGAT
jgi:hypothetical protein